MKCLVTGAAGFIGSFLCEQLLAQGHEVIGLDAFLPYYAPALKRRNLASAERHSRFRLLALDLRCDSLDRVIANVEIVFHLAATPGLAQSWTDFESYWTCNVLGTQRLLEALRQANRSLRRFVYASTSSVYGAFASGDETLPTKPVSPYGVTKLAGENLCRAYGEAYDLPVIVLRYFSVYGPRQRPDMGYHKFARALLLGEPLTVFGDGQQIRGNTYVDDCVAATIAVGLEPRVPAGEVFNVGGGEAATVWDILRTMEKLTGHKAIIRHEPARPGDQRYTTADTAKLRRHFGWQPRVGLAEGLARQMDWQRRELAQSDGWRVDQVAAAPPTLHPASPTLVVN